MAAVAGLRGTGDWGPDERPKNFRESILFMQQGGDTPIFGLTAKTAKMAPTDDPEFYWWAEPQDLVRVQVSATASSTATVITVDSSDPDAADIKKNWGLATHLKPGDVLLVEPATDTANDTAERLIVVGVPDAGTIIVSRGAMGTTPATINNDVFLLRIGSMYGEGTPAPLATSRQPIQFWNQTQIFKTAYELTGTAVETRTRTGDPLELEKKRKMFDHAQAIELAMLFSRKATVTDPTNGKPLRSMSGIREFIPAANRKILAADWGLYKSAAAGNNLVDMISPVFDYSTPAGDTRIAFCGNACLNQLNRAIASSGSFDVKWDGSQKVYGLNFRELIMPQGRLLIKTHPLLSRHALYSNSMWILDFSAIKYRAMKNRDTKAFHDVQGKDEDLRRGYWQTECSIMVDYAGQSCGYIGGFGAAFATT